MATHSSTPARKISGHRRLAGYCPWACKELDRAEKTEHKENAAREGIRSASTPMGHYYVTTRDLPDLMRSLPPQLYTSLDPPSSSLICTSRRRRPRQEEALRPIRALVSGWNLGISDCSTFCHVCPAFPDAHNSNPCLRTREFQHQESLKKNQGTSPVVWWLRLCTSSAGGMGSIRGRGTKIPHAV